MVWIDDEVRLNDETISTKQPEGTLEWNSQKTFLPIFARWLLSLPTSPKKTKNIYAVYIIAVIAITADAMKGDREKSGASEYINKPLDVHLLLQPIIEQLKKEALRI